MTRGEPDGLTFRRGRWSDGPKLAPLLRDLAGPMTQRKARRRFRRILVSRGYLVYVLASGDQPVALWAARTGRLFSSDDPSFQTIALVVREDLRGRGIARWLMINCPPGDREYCQSWLTTTHDELHPFYVSLGFKPTGTRFVRHQGTPGASIVIED